MAQDNQGTRKPSKFKASVKFLFNIPAWFGADAIGEGAGWIGQLARKVFFRSATPGEIEDFAVVVKRLGVDERGLEEQQKRFVKVSWVFFVLAIFDLFYVAYLWSRASFLVIFGAMIVCALFLIQAYSYSFWVFQIKQRKLGCTFKAWVNWILRGRV